LKQVSIISLLFILVFVDLLSAEQKVYRMATVPYAGAEPYFVALELDLFKHYGITIKEYPVSSMTDWFEALNSPRLHFNLMWSVTAVGRYLDTGDCIMTGLTNMDHDATKLIVKKNSNEKGKFFKGMIIGINADLLSYRYMVSSVLESYSLNISDVRIITDVDEHDLMSNFIAGRIDGILTHQAYIPKAIKEGQGLLCDYPENYLNPTLGGAMTPMERYHEIPEKDFISFWKAVLHAIVWIKNPANKKEYMRIIRKKFASNTVLINEIKTEEGFDRFVLRQQRFLISRKEIFYYNGAGLKNIYDKAIEVARRWNKDTSKIQFNRIFKTQPILKAYETLVKDGVILKTPGDNDA